MLDLWSKELFMNAKSDGKYLHVSSVGSLSDTCIMGNAYGEPVIYKISRTTGAIEGTLACGVLLWTNRAFALSKSTGSAYPTQNTSMFCLIDSSSNPRRALSWNLKTPIETNGVAVTVGSAIGTAYITNALFIPVLWCVTEDNKVYMSKNSTTVGADNIQYKMEILFKSTKKIKCIGITNIKGSFGTLIFGAGMYIKHPKGTYKFEDIPGTELFREERE